MAIPTGVLVRHEAGTDRGLYATWYWTQNNTDHYEVWWEYATAKKSVWITGSESSEKHHVATYSYPENAARIRFRVRAVAQTKPDSDKPYWNGEWSKVTYYTIPSQTTTEKGDWVDTIKKVNIILEAGTDRTLHATWAWKSTTTEYFIVQWQYYTANKKWFYGNEETVTVKESAYTAPANAISVRCRVRPIAKIKYELDTQIVYFWRAKFTNFVSFKLPDEDEAPAAGAPNKIKAAIQNGTDRTVLLTWNWAKHSTTDHYEVTWKYYSGDKDSSGASVWLDGGTSNVTLKSATYSAPDNARKVRGWVLPIAKKLNNKYRWSAKTSKFGEIALTAQASGAPKSLNLVREKQNTSSMVFSWAWSKHSTTDHYQVQFWYTTGNQNASGETIWFQASDVTATGLYATYTPPSNAVRVRARVKPFPKTAGAWAANWSEFVHYAFSVAATTISQLTKTVTDLQVDIQSGTDRKLYATWQWDQAHTDSYNVYWYYHTGQGVWFTGAKNTGVKERNSLYDAPTNAKRVACKVKPVATKHKVQGVDTYYWTADWSGTQTYNFEEATLPPAQANVPAVDIDGLTLTAETNTYDENTKIIEFQVVKDDSVIFFTGRSAVVTAYAAVSCPVAVGGEYKVRARGLNPIAGNSIDTVVASNTPASIAEAGEWSEYSSNVATIPSSPTEIISHTVLAPDMVQITWTEVPNVTGYKIEYALKESYFDTSDMVTSIDASGSGATRIIGGLESGNTYFFRVKAVNDQGDSGWTPIYSLVLGTRPSAPTTWSDTTTGVIGDDLYFYWTHNSEDASTQTAAEFELTVNEQTYLVDPTYLSDGSTPSYYIFNSIAEDTESILDSSENGLLDSSSNQILSRSFRTYPEGAIVRWRVRTKGVLDEWSPWSTSRTVIVYAQPVMELYVGNNEERNDIMYELTHYPLIIHGDVSPSTQKAISYNVQIVSNEPYETVDYSGRRKSIRDQEVVFSKYIPADSNTLDLVLTAGDVNLDSNITYTVIVTTGMDSSLIAEASWTFTARWATDILVPDAEITINRDSLCAYIRPFCNDENDELVENVLVSVYRLEYDGRLVEIAKNLPNGEYTVTDPHPSLNYARYRVVAMDESTGEIGFRNVPGQYIGETGIVVQWDDEWQTFSVNEGEFEDEFDAPVKTGSMLKIPYNVEVSDSTDIDVALNEYIGRSHPVSYYGTQLGVKGDWNAVIPATDMETLYALRRLAIYRGDVYVREPSGVGYWAQINVSFSKKYSDMTIPVSLSVTRVEGGI